MRTNMNRSWPLRLAAGLMILAGHAVAADPHSTGPEHGTLILAGGGGKEFDTIFGKLVELAGGPDAPIVIVPTAASSQDDYDYFNHRQVQLARERFGLTSLSVVHTHDREEAQRKEFIAPLRAARGLWFTGGRQWRLVDAYAGTPVEREFHKILERGGVVGGGSAGASIQGSFLVRGDTSGPNVLIGDHQQGFGFIQHAAIDQHLVARSRELDLIKILTDERGVMDPSIDRNSLLGIGLDEDTAILVRQHQFEVFGKSDGVVFVYDPRKWTSEMTDEEKYQTLHVGDQYDMVRRQSLKAGIID